MNRAAAAAVLCLAVLAVGVAWLRVPDLANHIQDDGFIYFRIAENAARGHGPVFNPGERVDAATSPVWLWLLALATRSSLPLHVAAAWLALAAWGAAIVLGARWALELAGVDGGGAPGDDAAAPSAGTPKRAAGAGTFGGGRRGQVGIVIAGCVGSLTLLADDRFLVYAFSGMETMLCAVAWLWAFRALVRRWILCLPARAAGWWVLLAALVRPEFVLLVTAVLVVGLLQRTLVRREVWRTLLPTLAGGAAYLLVHTLYFGDPLPNTYYAKRASDWAHLRIGLAYVARFPRAYPWVLALAVALLPRALRGVAVAFLAGLAVYAFQVARVGGDHFEFHRAFLYVLPIAATLVGAAAARLVSARTPWKTAVVGVLAAAMVVWSARPHVRAAAFEWVQLAARLGEALATQYPAGTRLGLFALGATGYAAGLPVVDALGIADRHVARCDLSKEHVCALDIGHERGDPAYVLQRADVVVFFAAYAPVRFESLDEIREGFYSHKKFLAAAKNVVQQGSFRLRNVEFMPGAYWAVLERNR